MKKFSLFVVFLVLLIASTSALAQDDDDDEVMDFLEVALFGGGSMPGSGISDWMVPGSPELGARNGILLGGDVGVFATANLVIGVHFVYSQYNLDTDENTGSLKHRFYNPSLYLKYYFFGESNLAPYLRVHAGIDNPKFTTLVFDDALQQNKFRELTYDVLLAFGGSAGVFYYTSDFSGLFLEGSFHYGLSKDVEGQFQDRVYVFQDNYTQFNLFAGVKMFFGAE